LIKLKKEVIVVSSGSIALGKKQLNLSNNLTLDEKQAAAATGQISLAHAWKEVMLEHGLNVAQILLAPDDTDLRSARRNPRIRRKKDDGFFFFFFFFFFPRCPI
jgi:glutamate 5-kinase